MNTLATQIQGLAAIISSAEEVISKFQVLRDLCSEEQWEGFSGPLAELLDACSELEYNLERE